MKRPLNLLLCGALTALLLTGCGGTDASAPPTEDSAAPQDVQDTQDTPSTQDTQFETLTPDVFSGHDLTLVNCFTTWCGPCVEEIPELNQLQTAYADRNVQVIGVILDSKVPTDRNDTEGTLDQEAISQAALIASRADIQYKFYLPDFSLFDGMLVDITAVPTTFFVNRQGEIVGETVTGARDLDGWSQLVDQQLADLGHAE